MKRLSVLICSFGSFHQREEIHLLLAQYREKCQYSFIFSKQAVQQKADSYWSDLGEITSGENFLTHMQLSEFDLILVPFLTRNSLAKIATGIADSAQLTILQHLFLMGKEILVSDHSYKTTTDHAVYHDLNQNKNYQQLIQNHEQTLKSFGAKVGTLQDFKLAFGQKIAAENVEARANMIGKKSQKLLTLQDVKAAPYGSFDSSSRMTDLAREYLQEKK